MTLIDFQGKQVVMVSASPSLLPFLIWSCTYNSFIKINSLLALVLPEQLPEIARGSQHFFFSCIVVCFGKQDALDLLGENLY